MTKTSPLKLEEIMGSCQAKNNLPARLSIIQATLNDLDEIDCLQKRNYSKDLFEKRETFCAKIKQYNEGCFIIRDEANKKTVGYLISHPGKYYELNETKIDVEDTENYFGADICLDKEYRDGAMFYKLHFFLEKLAKSKGFKFFNAILVNKQKGKYEQLGFEKIGEVKCGSQIGYLIRKKISKDDENEKS